MFKDIKIKKKQYFNNGKPINLDDNDDYSLINNDLRNN